MHYFAARAVGTLPAHLQDALQFRLVVAKMCHLEGEEVENTHVNSDIELSVDKIAADVLVANRTCRRKLRVGAVPSERVDQARRQCAPAVLRSVPIRKADDGALELGTDVDSCHELGLV